MKKNRPNQNSNQLNTEESGITSVVGEMLMIATVLILVSIFATTVMSFLPSDRESSMDIIMNHKSNILTFWHKGGDWAKASDIEILVTDISLKKTSRYASDEFLITGCNGYIGKKNFDLGDSLAVGAACDSGDLVKVVVGNNVVFSSKIGGDDN